MASRTPHAARGYRPVRGQKPRPAAAVFPAFWEDQHYGEDERSVVGFRIGDVNFEGTNPCARCPVPARDPQTAADLVGFQKRFTDLRRETPPPWAPAARFDHFYRLAVNTRVAPTEIGKTARLGDPLKIF